MALNLDPQTPVEKSIGGVTYLIRVMTQRERARFGANSHPIAEKFRGAAQGESVALDESEIVKLERCLQLGVAGWKDAPQMPRWRCAPGQPREMASELLESVPTGLWFDIYLAIIVENTVTEADSKNSPSPPQ